jgi:hypothetical protein
MYFSNNTIAFSLVYVSELQHKSNSGIIVNMCRYDSRPWWICLFPAIALSFLRHQNGGNARSLWSDPIPWFLQGKVSHKYLFPPECSTDLQDWNDHKGLKWTLPAHQQTDPRQRLLAHCSPKTKYPMSSQIKFYLSHAPNTTGVDSEMLTSSYPTMQF